VAIFVDICSSSTAVSRIEGLKWDMAVMPRGPRGRFTRQAGTGMGMHPQSKNPETAWTFLKWYTGPESPRAISDQPNTLHPIKAARESNTFMAWMPADAKRVWFETLEYGRYQAQHAKWQELMGPEGAQKHYEAALKQEVSVKAALEAIRQHAETVLGPSAR